VSPASAWVDAFEGLVRQIGNPDSTSALLSCLCIRLSAGDDDLAADLLQEVERTVGVDTSPNFFAYLPAAVRALLVHGRVEEVDRVLTRAVPTYAYAAHAMSASRAALDEARGNLDAAVVGYDDAARRWAGFGVVPEHAFASLGRGRSSLALGRPADARPALEEARAAFMRLRAAPALAETETLLAALTM
jgi:tetratricopeptide (TPR) repeat protein